MPDHMRLILYIFLQQMDSGHSSLRDSLSLGTFSPTLAGLIGRIVTPAGYTIVSKTKTLLFPQNK